MKSPARLEELPFASTLSNFDGESANSAGFGGLLEIDGDYDRLRFDGVVFAAADASGARFIESAFVGGSFLLTPYLGQNFFPSVDTGQILMHARLRIGTKVRKYACSPLLPG